MFGMGFWELVAIAVVALLVLGPEKLPEAAKTLSKGIRDFRRQTRELQQTIEADEEIGGAIRDIKSALRGDELAARTPSARAKPHAGSPQVDAAAMATAAGIGAGDVAPDGKPGDPADEDLRATRDMRRPGQASDGAPATASDPAGVAADPAGPSEPAAAAAALSPDAGASADGAAQPEGGIVLKAASGTVARSVAGAAGAAGVAADAGVAGDAGAAADAGASERAGGADSPAGQVPAAGAAVAQSSEPDDPAGFGPPPATDRDHG